MKFIDEAAPNMDERARYNEIVEAFDAEKLEGLNITLKEVSSITLSCEAHFMDRIRPTVLDVKAASRNSGSNRNVLLVLPRNEGALRGSLFFVDALWTVAEIRAAVGHGAIKMEKANPKIGLTR
jgi:hypothetical protein